MSLELQGMYNTIYNILSYPFPDSEIPTIQDKRENADEEFKETEDATTECEPSESDLGANCGGDVNYQWMKMLGQLRKRSSVGFSAIPLLGGYSDLSMKSLRKMMGMNHSSEDTVDGRGFVMPKPSWRSFTYEQLNKATGNFSAANLIGQGGHAVVYRGIFPDGQDVAVKKITKEEKSDENRVEEFLSELGIIAHIDHPNSAKLIGFSADNGLHLILEFCPHGSVSSMLHGSEGSMDWGKRFKVAVGVAEGLKYLHYDCQRRIIHRDITASNILLAKDYSPQISDYGLAKWLPQNWPHHVVSPIEGTFGYMAPEYFMHGTVNEKTDVYAFGVLLLELITGRRSVDSSQQSLVMWAKPLLEKNRIEEIVDIRLGEEYDPVEMKRAMFAASVCIHHLPNMRPNMKRLLQVLKGERDLVADVKQKSMGLKALLWEACDLEEYTSTHYLKDLDRHKELIMDMD